VRSKKEVELNSEISLYVQLVAAFLLSFYLYIIAPEVRQKVLLKSTDTRFLLGN